MPTLLSDSAKIFWLACSVVAGDKSFFIENNLVFLSFMGIGLELDLFSDRELWQRLFSLSPNVSPTLSVHMDVEMVDCKPLRNFLALVGVVGDEDIGDLDSTFFFFPKYG